jgi:cytochrome b
MSTSSSMTVRIWDLPTRLFHWALVLSVFLLLLTGSLGGNAMVWHFRLGYLVFTLLVFRVLWGLVGGYWSRWVQLPLSPRKVWAYLHGHSPLKDLVGHNPLGSWSVVSMIVILGLQVSSGLVSDDEIANAGPLSSLVSASWVTLATHWHKGWGKWIIIGLVSAHVLAVIWYQWRQQASLLAAMWHGDKQLNFSSQSSQDSLSTRLFAMVIAIACIGLVLFVTSLGS